MELLDYEKKHIEYLEKNAAEGTLFLKRNDAFPLTGPCDLVLVGNGARNTVKGGTGSGDVASRFFVNAEAGFKNAGFNIVSSSWLDEYDAFRKTTEKDYIKDAKAAARKYKIMAGVFTMGYFEEEKNYKFSPDFDGDACVYVLSRNSGEGNDRRNIKGDVKLSDKEVEDILYLNKKFAKFMLVLNVGGVVDLSPVIEVSNILLLSQLGVVTGTVLADIVLGNLNPSGKLSTTWAKPEDYPFFNEFGDINDTYYKEGIYVGYRYFNTYKKECLFPFGYGLSYTSFEIKADKIKQNEQNIIVTVNVKNTGKYSGKEVVMLYLSKPTTYIDEPLQILCAYSKSIELAPGEKETIELSFNLSEFASFVEKDSTYTLFKGDYIIYVGNDVEKTTPSFVVELKENVVISYLESKCNTKNSGVEALVSSEEQEIDVKKLDRIILDTKYYSIERPTYKKDDFVIPSLEELSDKELMLMTLGHHKTGFAAIVGSSCEHIVGGAGETVLCIDKIKEHLTMADGPAGLRLKQIYGVDKKGVYDVTLDPMMEKMIKFLPKLSAPFIMPPKNRHGELHYQFTTAIPIGTSIAQSFNNEYAKELGNLVAEEMEVFGVNLWLAPALNIHRNILCGRNFEYFSEDPYLSGMIAASITKGVEAHPNRGVTIKHFAANNQELNRNNNNAHITERALREIYLKGFEFCIKDSNPKSIMTSYNLINGTHTSESYELVNDILRCEWGYQGLVMTDWIASGRSWTRLSKYPAPYASNNILAGNDLTMSGCPKDEKDILKALKSGKLTRVDLLYSASRIYRSIKELNK